MTYQRRVMTPEQAEARRKSAVLRYYSMNPVAAWARSAVSTARRRAKRSGVPFEITAADLMAVAGTHCPALGIVLDYTRGRGIIQMDSPTVDRLIGPLGYVVGNVAVISDKANRIKGNCDPHELFAVGRWHGKCLSSRST